MNNTINDYLVLWLYPDAHNAGKFLQGSSQPFSTFSEAADFLHQLKEIELTGGTWLDQKISHVTMVDQTGRTLFS